MLCIYIYIYIMSGRLGARRGSRDGLRADVPRGQGLKNHGIHIYIYIYIYYY